MEYAASHDVQELEINCQSDHISNLIELPPSIFNCSSLTSLTLCLWDVTKPNTKMFPKTLNLPALKTLKLVCFTFFTRDNGYAEPFSTCNMLSKLVIMSCRLQDDAQGLCISNSKVSNLAIGTLDRNSNIHKVILYTPKLTSLTINMTPPIFSAPYTYNLTLLEELKFDCRFGDTMGEDILISWLYLLAKVKIMTLNFNILELMVNVSYFSLVSFLLFIFFRVLLTSAPGALFKHSIYRSFLLKKLSITISNALTLRIPVKIL
jgi:hypothetical protein